MTQLLPWIDKLDALQSVLLRLEVELLEVSRVEVVILEVSRVEVVLLEVSRVEVVLLEVSRLEVVLLKVSRSVIIPILMIPVRTRQPVLCQTADTGGDRTSPARVSSWYLNYSGCRKSNIKMKIVEICKNLSKVVKYK